MEIEREDCHGDEADRATYFIESVIDDHVKDAMRRVAQIPEGVAGECSICGEWSGRLVNDACSPCRDKFGIR
jgi:hypothetical protein